MSTTTCDAPTRWVSSSASRSPSSLACFGDSLEQQRLAEDRRGLGERHRQPALQRGAIGERDVVERVPELVRERRHRVEAAVEVHHHAADVGVDDRHAVRAAALAVADLGVDPVLVEGARREPAPGRGSSRRTRRARARSRPSTTTLGRAPTGANRSHHGSPPLVAEQARLGARGSGGSREATRRPRRSSRRASRGRRCWRAARVRGRRRSRGAG